MPFLAFEDAGGQKDRKWQCFCCGKSFDDYEAYSGHIKESHEQGREWLECPSCKAPVRDVKLHFKAKHPNRVLPSGLQTRVAVWKDFKPGRDGKTKGKVRKVNARQGTFASQKSGRDIPYRSGLEEEFLSLLEQDVDVHTFAYESLKVPYFYRGEWRDYIPDLKILFVDSTVQVWEIKPQNQTDYEQNKCKWAAANNYCANMGWEFIVQTEEVLDTYRWKVQRQFNEARRTVQVAPSDAPEPVPESVPDDAR